VLLDEGTVIIMVTGLQVGQLRNCGSYSGRTRDFSCQIDSGAHLASFSAVVALSLSVNQLGHEAYHSHLPFAEVKIEWSNTSACPFAYMTCTGRTVTLPLNFLTMCV
jgi:hypothetical protein